MSNVTKPRKYYFVNYNELNTIPLSAGNVIALIDANGFYYDVEDDGTTVRRNINGSRELIYGRPDASTPGEINILYICNTGETLTGTNITLFELYIWDDEWFCIGNNTNDINVSTLVDNTLTYYLTGSTANGSTTGRLIKRQDVYVNNEGKITAVGGFGGGKADNAVNADHAVNADNALVAEKDTANNTISGYIRNIQPNSSNPSVTITLGDGTSTSVNTFTPPVMSSTQPGLVPQIPNDTTKNVLYRSGWDALDVSGLPAQSATNDSANQEIVSTYIKDLSFDSNSKVLTATKGNDDTDTVSIPYVSDEYSGPGNGAGLVPASTSGDANRYLNVSGTWEAVSPFTGATSSTNGTSGAVIAPTTTDVDKFLKGNGSWSDIDTFNGSTPGLVPGSTVTDQAKYLMGDGTWADIPEYVGATASANGVAGLVNPANSGDESKFYRGDGQWVDVPLFVGSTAGLVPTSNASSQDKFLQGDGTWVSLPIFALNTNGAVPGPSIVSANCYLNSMGAWSTPVRNTTGTTDLGSSAYSISNSFTGDGTTTAYTLQYTPNAGTLTIYVDTTEIPSTDYSITNNVITFNTAPADGSAIGITYEVNASDIKLYITGGISQEDAAQTYTEDTVYILDGKLYSDDKEVVTVNSASADTSFTANAGLTIVSNKYGDSYYITLDGTATGNIASGSNVATTTLIFNKTYSLGVVNTNAVLFKLEGNSITCDSAISANDTVAVSFNALV